MCSEKGQQKKHILTLKPESEKETHFGSETRAEETHSDPETRANKT